MDRREIQRQKAKERQATRGFSFSRPLMTDDVRSNVMANYHDQLKAWKAGETTVQIFEYEGDGKQYTYAEASVDPRLLKLGRSKLLSDAWSIQGLTEFSTKTVKTYKKGKNVGKKYFSQVPDTLSGRVVYNCRQPSEEFQNNCVAKCTNRTRKRTNACEYYGAEVGNPVKNVVDAKLTQLHADHMIAWRGGSLKLTEEEKNFIRARRQGAV